LYTATIRESLGTVVTGVGFVGLGHKNKSAVSNRPAYCQKQGLSD
jgi:hypothetical protein